MSEKTIYRRGKTYFAELAGYKDDVLYIGFFDSDSSIQGDFNITFIDLSDEKVPQLNIFNDSWKAISLMPELFEYFSSIDGMSKSIDEIHNGIVSLGYKDTTSYDAEYNSADIKRLENSRDELNAKLLNITEQIKRIS